MDGQRGPGGASRNSGGRDDPRSLPTSKRRWIPPTLRRDALPHDGGNNDSIFRKVRGILNKLTPEKFQKLSDDLLNIGLDSTVVLKGVILLIFEKALDEPKYSFMYAQLCKRLSEEAPNFDPPDFGPCSFRRLLLNKCRDEFENRSKATEFYDSRDGPLTPEEEEQRQLAKRKMLGNVKFIGELGKLEMLHEAILHKCCQELLEKKRKRGGIRDMAEDLECLSQIMKTCGRILDSDKAKSLMDQYFDRMRILAANPELPSRIRFMLQDVTELRENKWVPRKVASTEGPRTIQQIREDAARDVGVYIPPPGGIMGPRIGVGGMGGGVMLGGGGGGGGGLGMNALAGMPGFFSRMANKSGRGGMDDVFGSLPMGAATLGTGPGVIPTQDKLGFDSNGFPGSGGGTGGGGAAGQGGGGGGGGYRARQGYQVQQPLFTSRQFASTQNNKQSMQNQLNQQQNLNNVNLPPRFKKMMMAQQQSQSNNEEVSLRPSANSMMLKPKTPSALPKSAIGGGQGGGAQQQQHHHSGGGQQHHQDPLLPPPPQPVIPNQKPLPSAVMMQKEAPILIKQASLDKSKAARAKDKGPTKEEVLKKSENMLEEHLNNKNPEESLTYFRELKVPERLIPDVLTFIMSKTLDRSESDRELASQLMSQLRKDTQISPMQFVESFKTLLGEMSELERDIPRVKSYVAGFAARAMAEELATLAEIAEPMESERHYPLFLLTLQHLHRINGKTSLFKQFSDSKVNLLNTLPEMDRTKERLAEILEDRGLSFLFPLLRIQSELWKQLQADPSPTQFYKWIKENLEPEHHTALGFVNALVTVLVKFISQETTLMEGSDSNSLPEKAALEKEKDLLEKFKPVLQAFLHDHHELQVVAVYALQVYCYSLHFPKGMLLRWFVNLYDLEVIEEEAFLKWKEDITDDYPGKGKALFQVNQWLTWLEEAESEEEEEGEA